MINNESELKEAEYQVANISYSVSNLRNEYENIFNNSTKNETPIEKDPLIIESLRELDLKITSNKPFDDIIQKIVKVIKKRNSENDKNDDWFDILSKTDILLAQKTSELKIAQITKNRIDEENIQKKQKINILNNEIKNIEKENEKMIGYLYNQQGDIKLKSLYESYQQQIGRYTLQKDEDISKRAKARKDLEVLEADLSEGYQAAESEFIPVFNEYARSFLGLDVSVELSLHTKGTTLALYIENSTRRDSYQLSESQRYFIDIALRMALIDLSAEQASVFIDTPEGSLDIAYESRAGRMLADFSKKGYQIVMTANINTSQLLLELSSKCKSEYMKLERMTNWTTLSDVQQQESGKIESAFKQIEDVLNS